MYGRTQVSIEAAYEIVESKAQKLSVFARVHTCRT